MYYLGTGVRCETRLFVVDGSWPQFHACAPLTAPPRIGIRARSLIPPLSHISGLVSGPRLSSISLHLCPVVLLLRLLNYFSCFWLHLLYTQPSTVDRIHVYGTNERMSL
jgi:hypothetical protein